MMTEHATDLDPDPWRNRNVLTPEQGVGFADLVEALRDVQDVVSEIAPPDDVAFRAAAALRAVVDDLRPHRVPELERFTGRRPDLPGRGSPLLLPLVIEEQGEASVRGRVRFRPFHLGGNGAAHGGTLPLLFDEIVGNLVNRIGGSRARTAYLHVNYRAITPLDVDLRVEASVDRVEGRKRWASGRLYQGDTLLSDAEGLFVELRPGQP
jgi:acyl-coenzyme A thioesterase PaaI-like protein